LAEIHEESDNIAAAIEEHERALGLIQARLEPHSRLIAEVYSRLAFDYSLEKRNEEARKAHVKAAECVEKRLALLEDEIAGDKGKGKSEDSPAATEEIAELRAILEDLREKVLSSTEPAM
jgi:tetratricopeptide (TPR) repeat protein